MPIADPEPRRRWFQFGLEAMFGAVALFAAWCAIFSRYPTVERFIAGMACLVWLIRLANKVADRGHALMATIVLFLSLTAVAWIILMSIEI